VEWIHLAEDEDRWRAVVNAVMNLRVLAQGNKLVIRQVLCGLADAAKRNFNAL
jgi:hypothetical protein